MNPQQQPGDPVKHVVLLMFENHSFDQMLGCFKEAYLELEGIDPKKPGANLADGKEFTQASQGGVTGRKQRPVLRCGQDSAIGGSDGVLSGTGGEGGGAHFLLPPCSWVTRSPAPRTSGPAHSPK